ncbi:hypothetical protein E1293_46385 [Actinomadura darangshiensis]|uniref:Type II toxin-antitoxin system RelE/ParE family toxin n=1 Tax=Actinomadura darangshiensis TaxID=705336 RepID=A0A4R4ZL81_9ACTN|nr:hypothetical protein [Actinomadura darangshiensis]TDD59513.1 hypothetical protein E1293_46385 [Actinomadura darangshiensis]
MNYRVQLHATALAQIGGLPQEAFDALVTSLAGVADRPWDAMALYNDQPEYRQVIFGTYGLVSFYVDDTAEILRVFDITWTG